MFFYTIYLDRYLFFLARERDELKKDLPECNFINLIYFKIILKEIYFYLLMAEINTDVLLKMIQDLKNELFQLRNENAEIKNSLRTLKNDINNQDDTILNLSYTITELREKIKYMNTE
jgi:hypothetical protein